MPSTRVAIGLLGDRQLADPVLLEDRDRLADPLGRPGEDDVRQRPGVVAVVEQVADPDDGARSWPAGRSRASTRRCRSWTGSSGRCRAGARRRRRRAAVGRAVSSRTTSRAATMRGPARAAGQDPLLAGQPAGHGERVAVADPDPAIDDGRVVGARAGSPRRRPRSGTGGRCRRTGRCPPGRRRSPGSPGCAP